MSEPWEDASKVVSVGTGAYRWYFDALEPGALGIRALDAYYALEHERARAERAESALAQARAEAVIARVGQGRA